MAAITFEELIAHVGLSADKLGKPCSDEHISSISLFLTNWQTVAPHLGLTETDEEDVNEEGKKTQDKRYKTLRTWKAKNLFKATYRVLVDVFLKIGRADLAEKVCRLLVDEAAATNTGSSSAVASGGSTSASTNSGDEELTEEDITDVDEYLQELTAPHLFNLGIALGLKYTRLKNMQASSPASFSTDLTYQWIEGVDQVKSKGKASWGRLVEALRTKKLGQTGLADRIQLEKCS